MFGSDRSRPKDYERALVVEVEVNETNKTALRSEWSSVPRKRKKEQKKPKKGLDSADTVRDADRQGNRRNKPGGTATFFRPNIAVTKREIVIKLRSQLRLWDSRRLDVPALSRITRGYC
jgi:hypothetical protein